MLTLRRSWSDGTTEFVFSELELTEKLAALVPPARKNRISYHGVLASNHRWRKRVVPNTPQPASLGLLRKDTPTRLSRWHPWADLLWRVFEVDGFACACGRRFVLHAVVLPPATLDVLAKLERSDASSVAQPTSVIQYDNPTATAKPSRSTIGDTSPVTLTPTP